MNNKVTRTDFYLIAIFFIIAIPVSFFGYDYSEGILVPVLETIIYCASSLFLTYVIVYKFFPRFFSRNQIMRLFLWTVLLMVVVGVLEMIGYRLVSNREILPLLKSYGVWFWALQSSAQNAGVLIGVLLGKKYSDAQLDLQKRDTEKRENELRLLKSQVDPHFLFNNLNTVDSLIDTDPKTAKLYLNKLAQLYRYLIHTKDDEVVPLEDELEFARNYSFLLEQRYGEMYKFRFDLKMETADLYVIPPGALQTCLENVVKHNSGTEVIPILTSIEVEAHFITVNNNKTHRAQLIESTGIGLTNLKKRYELLSDKKIIISDEKDFVVKLPLIKRVE